MKPTYELLISLSIDELRDLNQMVVNIINFKKELLAKEKMKELNIGDEVKVNHKKLFGLTLVVDKINKRNACLSEKETGKIWNVPIELIEII